MLILPTRKLYIILFCAVILFSWSTSGHANTANLKFMPETSGNQLRFSLVIDHAVQIAGMKITIVYDRKLLTFKSAEKSPATSSFMHVVNDKTPGKIIIVMASAKGITGDKVPLLHLEFTKFPHTDTDKKMQTITVTQIQLMNEKLKEIKTNLPEFTF